jgi:hypothetical protein
VTMDAEDTASRRRARLEWVMPVVERGVPLPTKALGGGRGFRQYPFLAMTELLDSFFMRCDLGMANTLGALVQTAAYSFRHKHRTMFSVAFRAVPGGVRVWRVR